MPETGFQSSISCTHGDGVENLVLTGSGDIDGTGNDLDNTIIGNAGANILAGTTGADTFFMTDLPLSDLIADYDFLEGDEIDLGASFKVDTDMSTATTDDDSVDQCVRIVANGAGNVDELQVDVDGGGDNFSQTIATLDAGSLGDAVRIVVSEDGSEATSGLSVV